MYQTMLTLIERGKLDPSTEEHLRGFLEKGDRTLNTLLAVFKVISALNDVLYDKVEEVAEHFIEDFEDLQEYISKEQESNWTWNRLGKIRNFLRVWISVKLCESTPLDIDTWKIIWPQMFTSDEHFERLFKECTLDALTFE